jgi:CubicO group peptidase (beta-lactamase class C family)
MTDRLTDGPGISLALLFTLLLSACGGGGDAPTPVPPPPPVAYEYRAPADIGDSWTVSAAPDTGMAVEPLESMMQSLLDGEFDIIDSIAVVHRGQLILHETVRTGLNPFDEWVDNTDLALHAQFSASKSMASVLVGVAVDDGIFDSVDTPFLSFFDYPGYDNWDARKSDITLHDVLAMRLGLEWNEWDPPYADPDNQMLRFYRDHVDYARSLLDLPLASDPGTMFAYNTVATVALGQAIENRGPLSLIDYGGSKLLAPMAISSIEVFLTPTGLPDLGRGLYLTTRDMAKFGQLYLDGGRWNGQQLVSEDWVSRSLTAYTEFGWSNPEEMGWQIDGYGYQWWLGHFDIDGVRYDTFAAWGHGEQWIMSIPALELVVAINAHAWEGRRDQTNQVFELIRRFLIPAVAGG